MNIFNYRHKMILSLRISIKLHKKRKIYSEIMNFTTFFT